MKEKGVQKNACSFVITLQECHRSVPHDGLLKIAMAYQQSPESCLQRCCFCADIFFECSSDSSPQVNAI